MRHEFLRQKTSPTAAKRVYNVCAYPGAAMIDHQTDYRFRHAIDPQPGIPIEPWDRRIAESHSFIAIPTQGSLVPGWVLILPRRKAVSISALANDELREFFEFREVVARLISSEFGPPTFFEHGAGFLGSMVGCGVDHAHVHIVPLEFDLIKAAENDLRSKIVWNEIEDERRLFSYLQPHADYMSISSPTGRIVFATEFVPISQYLRRLIATQIGVIDKWDYQVNPFRGNVLATLTRLKSRA